MESPLTSSDDDATGRGTEGSATTNSLGPGGSSGPYFISSGILAGPSSLTSPTGTIAVEAPGSPEAGVGAGAGSVVLPSPETTNAVGDAGSPEVGVGAGAASSFFSFFSRSFLSLVSNHLLISEQNPEFLLDKKFSASNLSHLSIWSIVIKRPRSSNVFLPNISTLPFNF